jgi:hypothetical protein
MLAIPTEERLKRALSYMLDENEFLSPYGLRSVSRVYRDKPYTFYGDRLTLECPTGSGKMLTLRQVAAELSRRLTRLFLRDEKGARPCHGNVERFASDPHWRELLWFHEYFHGDTGRGLGANHQTGWTALVVKLLKNATDPDYASVAPLKGLSFTRLAVVAVFRCVRRVNSFVVPALSPCPPCDLNLC